MNSNYDPERVFQVACPECGAQPGERCKSKKGTSRNKRDYHMRRKGAVYPEFVRSRQGLSDPAHKATKVMDAIERYIDLRTGSYTDCRTPGERAEHVHAPKIAAARRDLLEALKEGFTHGK